MDDRARCIDDLVALLARQGHSPSDLVFRAGIEAAIAELRAGLATRDEVVAAEVRVARMASMLATVRNACLSGQAFADAGKDRALQEQQVGVWITSLAERPYASWSDIAATIGRVIGEVSDG